MFLLYWTKFPSVGSSVVKYDFDVNMLQPPQQQSYFLFISEAGCCQVFPLKDLGYSISQ